MRDVVRLVGAATLRPTTTGLRSVGYGDLCITRAIAWRIHDAAAALPPGEVGEHYKARAVGVVAEVEAEITYREAVAARLPPHGAG